MTAPAWKPTYDLYRTKAEAEARCSKMRRNGYSVRIRRVAKATGKGSLVLNPRYTVDYKDRP